MPYVLGKETLAAKAVILKFQSFDKIVYFFIKSPIGRTDLGLEDLPRAVKPTLSLMHGFQGDRGAVSGWQRGKRMLGIAWEVFLGVVLGMECITSAHVRFLHSYPDSNLQQGPNLCDPTTRTQSHGHAS